MKSINPTTGEVIKVYDEYSLEECDNIIKHAYGAFQKWSQLPIEERGLKLRAVGEILKRDRNYLAELMANEMGKPIKQGLGEIDKCVLVCEFYAEHAKEYLSDELVKTEASKSYIHYEPLGVVLAVMPWNFPFWQVFRCAAPILMAGNTMVLKHAGNVSGVSLAIENIFKLVDFPSGALRSIVLDSHKVHKLIEHPFISAVTLTGSVAAGQSIASKAGAMLKKTVLELGGNDAYLVLEDADLAQAAEICAVSRLINGGQSCVSAKRFIVVQSIAQRFEKIFIEEMKEAYMGSPMLEQTTLGPLARHDLRDQVHKQVVESINLGAKLLLGGEIPKDPGAYYPATILTDVKPGMPAYGEEIFGPVASIIVVDNEQEAIRVANDSVFGLGAAVFTNDQQKGELIAAKHLQAGCCFVNEAVKSDPRLPFGGIKHSGYGRELSVFGIREFVNVKAVYIK